MKKLNDFGLSIKIGAVVVVVIAAIVTTNYVIVVRNYTRDVQQDLMDKAAAFTAVADETKNHTSDMHAAGSFDTQRLLDAALDHVKKGGSYRDTDFYNTIPVVAGWNAAGDAAEREQIDFRVVAFEPRNKDNLPAKGSFVEAQLQELEAQIKSGGSESLGKIDEAANTLYYMRAVKLDESCMMCHGDPAKYDVPDAEGNIDGKDPLGFAMESWQPGDMHGAYMVALPLNRMDQQVAGFIKNGLFISVPLVALGIGVFAWLLRILMGKPLGHIVATLEEVARGNLTRKAAISRGDEVGRLSAAIDSTIDSLHSLLSDVAGSSRQIAAASTQIAASAEEMSSGLSKQEGESQQVAAAVEEMNATVQEVARQSSDAASAAKQSQQEAAAGARRRRDRHRNQGHRHRCRLLRHRRHHPGRQEPADRRDHQGHQRHRRPDQPPRPQRRHRGRQGRRARAWLRRRRRRGQEARRTHHQGHRGGRVLHQGHPGPDRLGRPAHRVRIHPCRQGR